MLKLLLMPILIVFGIGGGLLAVGIHKKMSGQEASAQRYQDAGDMVLKEGGKFLKSFYTFLLGAFVALAIGGAAMLYLFLNR